MSSPDDAHLLARARAKVAAARRGDPPEPTIGRDPWQFVPLGVMALPFVLLGLYAAALALGLGEPREQHFGTCMLVGVALFLLPLLLVGFGMWRDASTERPEGALRAFYRALAKKKFARASRHVLRGDLDDLLRHHPRVVGLGHDANAFTFETPDGFARYWRSLLHHVRPWPYCIARVRRPRVHRVGEDLAIVDYELGLEMNTSAWWLLLPAGILIAAVIDLATRTRVKLTKRRVLMRVGNEWRIVNGDWNGPEDGSADWAVSAAAASSMTSEARPGEPG